MPNTPISGLPTPASSDSPNGPAQISALATALDSKVIPKVSNQAARDALPATAGLVVFRLDTGDLESYFGGTWSRIAGPLIQGKAWRTSGFSATIPAGSTTVDMTASRTVGGVTFDTTNNTLTVPRNGFYDLRGRGYASGGGPYEFTARIVRQRSSVADRELILSNVGHKIVGIDEPVYASDLLPLQAGDKVFLRAYFTGDGLYYGTDETNGVYLSVTYVGPLAGATPV